MRSMNHCITVRRSERGRKGPGSFTLGARFVLRQNCMVKHPMPPSTSWDEKIGLASLTVLLRILAAVDPTLIRLWNVPNSLATYYCQHVLVHSGGPQLSGCATLNLQNLFSHGAWSRNPT